MKPWIQFRKIKPLLVIALLLAWVGHAPLARAVVPPPDGGYPGFNTAEGQSALLSLTTGVDNTAVGFAALGLNLVGSDNTGVGTGALLFNTASNNTALGSLALLNNISGTGNTAIGSAALFSNTTIGAFSGDNNTAVGINALTSNTVGDGNTAVGSQALAANLGSANTAFGRGALQSKQLGALNTAMGANALFSLTGLSNLNSGNNTALGAVALFSLTEGDSNTAVGLEAGQHLTTGSRNTIMGFQAGTNLNTGDGNIYIDSPGAATESNTIRIGNTHEITFIAGITGVDEGNPTAVFINTTTGQLGTAPPPSSSRYKKGIKSMDKASEAILALKPVTFQYRTDKTGTPQFGLIAEEVAEVNPDLIVRNNKGDVYSVRYDAVNAMLLNEFLKEHRKNEKQEATIADLKAEIATLSATVKEQTAQIQKVNALLEIGKRAPQLAENN